jgi:Peptidase A4 family
MKNQYPRRKRLWVEELESRLALSGILTGLSTNWSGYAVTAPTGTVTSVVGSWVVPTVTGTSTAYSADWVGIDGFNSSTVEQIGTDSDISGRTPSYYAWYEMYPNYPVDLGMTIAPGDKISASVSYSSSKFMLQITDNTTGKEFSTTQSLNSAKLSSAEWIVEAPSSSSGVLPLADFGAVTFSQAQATIGPSTAPVTAPIDSFSTSTTDQIYQINMVSSRGETLEAATSSLSATTPGFSVTDDAPAPTSPPPPPPSHGRPPFGFRVPDLVVQQATTSPADSSFVTAALSANTTAQPSAQAFVAALAQPVAGTPSPVINSPTLVPYAFRQGGAGQVDDTDDSDNGGRDQPMAPASNDSGVPGNQAASQVGPGAFVVPNSASGGWLTNLPGAALVWNRPGDVWFMEEQGAPATPNPSAGELVGQVQEKVEMPVEAATGMLLAFALNGSWSRSREDTETRRRRLKLS